MPTTTGTATDFITFTRASMATRVNASGLIETVSADVARRDFDPVTLACRGLLVEEQRTNLLTYSNTLTNAAWFPTDMTVAATGATSPDGTNNGNVLTVTGTSAYIFQSVTVSSGVACTASIWIKGVSSSVGKTARLWHWYAGTATGSNTSTDIVLTGNWQRVTVTSTPTGSGTMIVRLDPEGINTSTVNDVIYVYGAQAENGAFATSYIPTTSATVTRSADIASVATSSFPYSSTEGSLVVACSTLDGSQVSAFRRPFALEASGSGSFQVGATYVYDGSAWRVLDQGETAGKHGVALKTNDFSVVANGGAARTGTGTYSGSDYNILRFGAGSAGSNCLNGHIQNITYIPRRLTNAELQARTA